MTERQLKIIDVMEKRFDRVRTFNEIKEMIEIGGKERFK